MALWLRALLEEEELEPGGENQHGLGFRAFRAYDRCLSKKNGRLQAGSEASGFRGLVV